MILWGALFATAGILGASAFRGLEGTDEASYLLTAANPWASPGNGIFSGFLLHPLWFVTGHVGAFRIAGMAVLVFSAIFFSRSLIQAGPSFGAGQFLRQHGALVLPSLCLAALSRYSVGIRTPGYDWAVLVCTLLMASAWFSLESRVKSRPISSAWVALFTLAGLGVFVAKWMVFPGVMMLFAALLCCKIPESDRGRLLGLFFIWVLFWSAALVLYITPEQISATVRAGFAQLGTGSHEDILRHYSVGFAKGSWQVIRALPWIFGLYGCIWVFLRLSQGRRPETAKVAGLCFLAALGLLVTRGHWLGGQTTFSKGMMIAVVWLIGVIFLTRLHRHLDPPLDPSQTQAMRRALLLLVLLPLLNGAGTATGITDYLAHGAIFFAAAGWILLGQSGARGLPVWTVAAAALCLGIIQAARAATSTLNTYRVGSVWNNKMIDVSAGPEQGRLKLFPSSVESLKEIYAEMIRSGYREGDPIIGITDCPGLVYLLGGVSPGACWYISYYLPENPGVKMNLQNIPDQDLARAWVLLRESARANERIEQAWPAGRGIPQPRQIQGQFFWPWGDGEGKLERISIYRPTQPGR